MGKPFKSELQKLSQTYEWALCLENTGLKRQINAAGSYPLVAIGSGGSQSTAVLISDLHQSTFGEVAKADTPVGAWNYLKDLRSSAILLVSAGGKNPDILGIARAAVEAEPRLLIAICATQGSPLARIVNGFARGFCFDFGLPSGKDGFLATNSLLAMSVIALRAFGYDRDTLPPSFPSRQSISRKNGSKRSRKVGGLRDVPNLVVLHGAHSRSAAFDLESKLVEAGLVSVQLADYRNFAHGRHHWLAKHPDSSVVAFASKEERLLADRTLRLLPHNISWQLIATQTPGYASWVELQAAVFELVSEFGDAKSIDPGRPGVPAFGRRIYHLNAFHSPKKDLRSTAIARKRKSSGQNNADYLQKLDLSFSEMCAKLRNANFNGLVLDYDGTICDHVDRFEAIPQITARAISRVVEAGFLLGIATGRGKSVRKALQAAIEKSAWSRVKVGYYNGAVVADLGDDAQPDTSCGVAPGLQDAADALRTICAASQVDLSIRPQQITVEPTVPMEVMELWSRVTQRLEENGIRGVKVVASTRSVDVVLEETSKLALVRALEQTRPRSTLLCIGDRPCWPGNDAQLLGQDFSLSVDEVDGNPSGAWNLSPAGVLGAAALRYYLSAIKIGPKHFSIQLRCD